MPHELGTWPLYRFIMAFATVEASAAKSLATGLSDRSFSESRHIGFRVVRMSTAIAVSNGCLSGSLSVAPGRTDIGESEKEYEGLQEFSFSR